MIALGQTIDNQMFHNWSVPCTGDVELDALSVVGLVMEDLNLEQRTRILNYISDRWERDQQLSLF